ncbi:hypothetical protein Ancab_017779 [Ancistrocladus abbreviatus]
MANASLQRPQLQQQDDNGNRRWTGVCKCPCNCGARSDWMDKDNYLANVIKYLSSFPAGYRFHPLDEELVVYYLDPKVFNKPDLLPPNLMHEINVYNFNPDTLSETHPAQLEGEWYFFTPRDKKYKNGTRPNRAADGGYWKATGADKKIVDENGEEVGFRKALVFYQGKAPNGIKTSWIMHEYRVKDPPEVTRGPATSMRLDDWVLCRIYKKAERSGSNNRARQQNSLRRDGDGHDNEENDEQERGNDDISSPGSTLPSNIRNPLPTTATTPTTIPDNCDSGGYLCSSDSQHFTNGEAPTSVSFMPTSYFNQNAEEWTDGGCFGSFNDVMLDPMEVLNMQSLSPLYNVETPMPSVSAPLLNELQQLEGGNISNGREVAMESYPFGAFKQPDPREKKLLQQLQEISDSGDVEMESYPLSALQPPNPREKLFQQLQGGNISNNKDIVGIDRLGAFKPPDPRQVKLLQQLQGGNISNNKDIVGIDRLGAFKPPDPRQVKLLQQLQGGNISNNKDIVGIDRLGAFKPPDPRHMMLHQQLQGGNISDGRDDVEMENYPLGAFKPPDPRQEKLLQQLQGGNISDGRDDVEMENYPLGAFRPPYPRHMMLLQQQRGGNISNSRDVENGAFKSPYPSLPNAKRYRKS